SDQKLPTVANKADNDSAPAKKAQTGKAAGNDAISAALTVLGGSPNTFARKKAAEFLGSAPPVPGRRDDVINALKNYLRDPDIFVRKAVVQAYGNWMTKEQAEGLYPALNDQD